VQTARNVRGREVQTFRNVRGREVQTSRNRTIQLVRSFYLISQSVWDRNETVVIGRIVIKFNCITVRIGNHLTYFRLFFCLK
jgi:hypothetical protein